MFWCNLLIWEVVFNIFLILVFIRNEYKVIFFNFFVVCISKFIFLMLVFIEIK